MKKRKKRAPKNKQIIIVTKENNGKRKREYDDLEIYHQMAIDMRLDGYTYFLISFNLKKWADKHKSKFIFPESEMRRWFAPGCLKNICYFAYQKKKAERAKERETNWKELDKSIQEGAVESVVTLRSRVRKGHVTAAEILLKYAGKEPVQKHEIEQKTPTKVITTVILSNGKHARTTTNPNAKAK